MSDAFLGWLTVHLQTSPNCTRHCLVQFVAQRLNLLLCSLVKRGVTLSKTQIHSINSVIVVVAVVVFILTRKIDRKELEWTDAYARSHQRAVLRGN